MPTPVSAARQCLAGEAATALDEAVAVARRRCHAQTTSLHVVSALLSLPSTSTSSSSILRDALARARSASCSPRLQFKALELCFSVALDRLPSSSSNSSSTSSSANGSQPSGSPSEPPVSNSLMAAIKRSQANQRRNPETFHLYQQQQQLLQQQQTPQSPTFSGVKVELQQLILAILDDPVVSRVFGEAGFRSCDIKYAVLRPPPTSILRFPRPARCPPLFLCNFSTSGDEFGAVSHRSFSFPFSKQLLYTDGSDNNCRRIGEVLLRKKGRNPLLVGAGAAEALQDLAGVLGKEKWSSLPQEMLGLKFFSLEKDLSDFIGGGRKRASLETRIKELNSMLSSSESGVVVSIGDLKGFLDEKGSGGESKQEGLEYTVSELTKLIGDGEGLSGKMWLVGSSVSYETYMKFLAKFPSVDKDWDLQLLPITSVRGGSPGMSPKPSSLINSSVPPVGFFPVASNSLASPSRPHQSAARCDHCNDKYEEEVAALLKENSVPVPELQKSTCSTWLQKAPISFTKSDTTMAREDSRKLKDKVADLEKKWNDVCQRFHCGINRFRETNVACEGSESFSWFVPNVSDKGIAGFPKSSSAQEQDGLGQVKILPITVSLEKYSSAISCLSAPPVVPEPPKANHSSELAQVADCLPSPSRSQTGNHSSAPSVSVSTDLMLGPLPVSTDMNMMSNPTTSSGLARCFSSTNPDVVNGSITVTQARTSIHLSYSNSPLVVGKDSALSPSSSNPKFSQAGESKFMIKGLSSSGSSSRFDPGEFKSLYRSLVDKIGRQEEAIFALSEAVTRCKHGNGRHGFASTRRGIWLRFIGPDRVGKKMIAESLAELLFGNKEKLISVDLGLPQDGSSNPLGICDEGFGGYNENVRGKMVVDHIADELRRLPWSVVLLENVDKADFLVQNSLNQAIKTGRFPDSHGREITTSNKIFIMTTSEARESTNSPGRGKVAAVFCEENILAAQKWQMKISIDSALKPLSVSRNTDQFPPSPGSTANKRKLNNADDTNQECRSSETTKRAHRSSNSFPDLNVPFEATTADDDDDSSRSSETSTSCWLDDFFPNVDEIVVFRPFDFDALAEHIRKQITRTFQNTIGSNCKLGIDQKAMEQILAATWLSEGNDGPLNNWVRTVLGRSFAEARERYNLSAHTIVRLVACEDVLISECDPGIPLPPRIPLD